MDIDMTSGIPWMTNPDNGEICGAQEGPVPVVRLYGVTSLGTSVLVSVHGFTPYLYALLPQSIELSDQFLTHLRVALDSRVSIINQHAYIHKHTYKSIINRYYGIFDI